MSKYKSKPLVSMKYRNPSSKSEFMRHACQAADMERNGSYVEAEESWIKAARFASDEKNIEWATCRAHYCARAQGKDSRKGQFITCM